MEAQRRLSENFAEPPSLDDLARSVGLSRSSLCAGFRQILGQSVFAYIGDLRMRLSLPDGFQNGGRLAQIVFAKIGLGGDERGAGRCKGFCPHHAGPEVATGPAVQGSA